MRASSGFVLVGVVMMVLALTILGLSLFSLSGYEAQFLNHSLDEERALQYAMGGLARARFALSVEPSTLSRVRNNLPPFVTYTCATQERGGVKDSMGLVVTPGEDVNIVVQAEYRGVVRRVEGWYIPKVEDNYYKRLLTISGTIMVNEKVGQSAHDAIKTVVLNDSAWVSIDDPTWQGRVLQAPGVNAPRYVPTPLSSSFISSDGATQVPYDQPTYVLSGSQSQVRRFYTDNLFPAGAMKFSSYYQFDATISVSGKCVWMLPKGLRIGGMTHITGNPTTDALVIIAGNGYDRSAAPDPGAVWFFGGLNSDIPLILVSDGWVKIEAFQHPTDNSTANNLSIFAGSLLLTGPESAPTSGHLMTLRYDHSTMDPLIDYLMSSGALPNGVNNSAFAMRRGKWRQVQ